MIKSTPKDLFLLGALRRSHAENFYETWLVPIELTREYCLLHAESFDWYAMGLRFLDKNGFNQFNGDSIAVVNEKLYRARNIHDKDRYKDVWRSCQELLAYEFFLIYEANTSKPFYIKFWNWITS